MGITQAWGLRGWELNNLGRRLNLLRSSEISDVRLRAGSLGAKDLGSASGIAPRAESLGAQTFGV